MGEDQLAEVSNRIAKKIRSRVDPVLIGNYLKEKMAADDTVKLAQGARDGVKAKYAELGVSVEDVDRMAKAVTEINKIVTPQEQIGLLMQAVSSSLGFATDLDQNASEEG